MHANIVCRYGKWYSVSLFCCFGVPWSIIDFFFFLFFLPYQIPIVSYSFSVSPACGRTIVLTTRPSWFLLFLHFLRRPLIWLCPLPATKGMSCPLQVGKWTRQNKWSCLNCANWTWSEQQIAWIWFVLRVRLMMYTRLYTYQVLVVFYFRPDDWWFVEFLFLHNDFFVPAFRTSCW